MDTFGLRIIASDKVFFNGRCKKLTIPAPDGEKGVLAHHENMVIAVVVGIARMESTEGEVTEIAVGTGAGLRLDVNFFLLRFDLGLKLHDPMQAEGQRFVLLNRNGGFNKSVFNIAIGYPF